MADSPVNLSQSLNSTGTKVFNKEAVAIGAWSSDLPKVKRSWKLPPDGWELIEPTLDELDKKMREDETEPHEGKRKVEYLWPIFKIHNQKTQSIFDLFYKRKAVSRELCEYGIKEGCEDKNLMAKWKKQGSKDLCCLRCIQTRNTNFGTNCICRVPKSKMEVGRIVKCTHCGCRGCSGWHP
uniref:protein BUD31 homolog n=1 Tax=Myodes glareolus TaxID=447135 RepID=UPI0020226B49|nr:protein BUD31 homolog [Myodes glareolus]